MLQPGTSATTFIITYNYNILSSVRFKSILCNKIIFREKNLKNILKRIPAKIKNEILEKVQNGMIIKDVARQYSLSIKTI